EIGPDRMTPLLMASASGHEELSIFFLEKGANPNAADSNGATALHYALQKGMTVLSGTYSYVALNRYLFRPNMTELAKALLAHKADPNAQITKDPRLHSAGGSPPRFSMIGATPFMLATASLDANMMQYLREHGADPLTSTKTNITPLMIAAG